MTYRCIGNDKVSAIAQGITKIGNSSYERTKRINIIKSGIELGLNFIDTAELYGNGISEGVVGKAIKGLRDDVFLSSKFNPTDKDVSISLNNSLKRLKTYYVDLYQIHFSNPTVPIINTMKSLSKLVDDGKIRYVGLSNFSIQEFNITQQFFDKKIVSNQLEYNLLDRSVENTFIPFCKENNISLIAYSPLNKGRIYCNCNQKIVLSKIAKKHDKTIAQVVLRWITNDINNKNVIAVVKTGNFNRLKENAESLEFELEKNDIIKINNLQKENVEYISQEYISFNNLKNVYRTIDEAINNKMNLIPSPVNLAKVIKECKILKPVRVIKYKDGNYTFDKYDIMDQIKKYWAWIIAYGHDVPIPAFIMNEMI